MQRVARVRAPRAPLNSRPEKAVAINQMAIGSRNMIQMNSPHCQPAIYLRKPFRKQVFGEHLAMALNATRFKQPKKADTAQESSASTALKA